MIVQRAHEEASVLGDGYGDADYLRYLVMLNVTEGPVLQDASGSAAEVYRTTTR